MSDKLDFYQKLRQRIHNWAKEKGSGYPYLEYLLLVPDFFYLLVQLILDKRVPVKEKAILGIVVAYYISPIDIIPEAFLGPIGYSDDLVLSVWAINRLLHSVSREVLLEHWPSEQDLFLAIERIMGIADQLLGKTAYLKLKNFFKERIDK